MQSGSAVFWASLLVFIFIVVIFRWGRFSGIKTNTRLYMRKGGSSSQVPDRATMSPDARNARPEEGNFRDLNVLFMFNGHSFEAHEVLGIPPGSSLPAVEAAYRKLATNIESKEFIDTAYRVLRQELTRQR